MRFPDELMTSSRLTKLAALGAFDKKTLPWSGHLRNGFFAYNYLADLKVTSAYRGQVLLGQLLDRRRQQRRGSRGIYTIGQDNNPNCLSLLSCLWLSR